VHRDKRGTMIKTFLVCIFSLVISFSASAQWWKKVNYVRYPLLQPVNTKTDFSKSNSISPIKITAVTLPRSRYSCDLEEAAIMKELYHTLRFRMYTEAISGLNRLVNLYITENRYSEAKWYLLQCNYFGHKSSNNDAVIASLVSLGMLKADIGEYDQAKEDLKEAQSLCQQQGRKFDANEIEKKLKIVEIKRFANVKNEIQYAEAFDAKKG
jgi:hypothetical protein